MKPLIQLIFLTFTLTSLSCRQSDNSEIAIQLGWTKRILPNGWTLYAPKNFTDTSLQGIDSQPGIIYSPKDSIYLQYDSGTEWFKKEDCDFEKSVLKAKDDISNGFYKDFYKLPVKHTAYIDTINNKIAIIIKPTKTGDGSVAIHISDCNSGAWLGIHGTNLSASKEQLIINIFKTIKLEKTN